jgi:hypothetical protein
MVAACKNPLDRATESSLARLMARISLAIHDFWIPAIPDGGMPFRNIHRYAQINKLRVIPAGKRVSSAMDGELKSVPGDWIPAIHAGMTA